LAFLKERLPNQHERSLNYQVLVVGTKSDLLTADEIQDRIRHMKDLISEKPEIPIRPPIISSSKQYDAVQRVAMAIRTEGNTLLRKRSTVYVPERFLELRRVLTMYQQTQQQYHHHRPQASLAFESFSKHSTPKPEVLKLIRRIFLTLEQMKEIDSRFDESSIAYLHSIGCVVYNAKANLVCVRPQFFSKVTASFLTPHAHDADSPHAHQQSSVQGPVVPRQEAGRRIRLLLQQNLSSSELDAVLQGMEQFDICYHVTAGQASIYPQHMMQEPGAM
jgi:hypothetical protein